MADSERPSVLSVQRSWCVRMRSFVRSFVRCVCACVRACVRACERVEEQGGGDGRVERPFGQ